MKKTIKGRQASILAVLGALLLILSGCSGLEDKKTLYFAHALPTTHPVHQALWICKNS